MSDKTRVSLIPEAPEAISQSVLQLMLTASCGHYTEQAIKKKVWLFGLDIIWSSDFQ